MLGVGWTLNLEMMFYAVFGICLIASRKWAPLLAAIAIVAIQTLSGRIACGPACAAYNSDYLRFFALGVGVFYAWRAAENVVLRHSRASAGIAFLAIAAWPLLALYPRGPMIHYGVPTVVVFAALCLHTSGFTMRGRLSMGFGSISYALYLLHPLVIETLRACAPVYPWMTPNTFSGMVASVVGSVILATGAYYWFEKPVLRRLNQTLGKHSQTRDETRSKRALAAGR